MKSTRQINRDFRIKVAGMNDGRKINSLFGVSGIVSLIGEEMFSKLLERAYASSGDVCYCKLRRGLKVSFYCK